MAPLRASVSGMQMLDISPDGSEMLALKPDLNDENGTRFDLVGPGSGRLSEEAGEPDRSRCALVPRWPFDCLCRLTFSLCE